MNLENNPMNPKSSPQKIEIISHCWRYSRVLRYQLSSLLLYHRPDDVVLTVFYAGGDQPTVDLLAAFQPRLSGLWAWPLPRSQLLTRAIGRNLAAKETSADIVWFTDCDYIFGPDCLDTLAEADLSESNLWFPPKTHFTKTRQIGDEYALAAADTKHMDRTVWVDPRDLVEHRLRRAIGGVQIVSGDVARRFGYCDEPKWQRPMPEEETHFPHTRSDKRFRRILGSGGKKIDLPNVWRVRQSEHGLVDQLSTSTEGTKR